MPVYSLATLSARLNDLPVADAGAIATAMERQAQLTKPVGSLGRLEELSGFLAAWQRHHPPKLERVRVAVFAGNHGIAARGVSAYPTSVTAQMLANFERGGAAINQLSTFAGAELLVVPLLLDRPTADSSVQPAMGEAEFLDAFNAGVASVEPGLDLLAVGEMGIGNTTAAAMLAHAFLGEMAATWTGIGTGVDRNAYHRKCEFVRQAVRLHREASVDALDLARRLGGRELAAIAGAVFQARLDRVPVLLDGYVATAAVLPLVAAAGELETGAASGGSLAHCQAAHVSAEPGHRLLLQTLGLKPLLDLEMRLGEASGAALAISLLRAALACHNGMATFAEAAVDHAVKEEDNA